MMEWTDSELNIKCLLGKSIQINGIGTLKPLTIDEISEIGFEKYNQYLSLICINSDDIIEMLNIDDNSITIEPFEFIFENCKYNEDFKINIINALSLFFKDTITFDMDMGSFFIGIDGVLHQGNYNFFVDVLKRMNCIEANKDKVNFKPKTESEKQYFKDLKKNREKYRKYYQDDTDISDIISAICSKHQSINFFNVKDLTMYQLIDIYKRIAMIDNYFVSIDSILHGADSKDVNVIHWSAKYQNN